LQHKLPIIADEVYGNLVYSGNTFHPLGTLSKTVPVLTSGGIAKEFLVPG
jgi:tyrosine aminotransferase